MIMATQQLLLSKPFEENFQVTKNQYRDPRKMLFTSNFHTKVLDLKSFPIPSSRRFNQLIIQLMFVLFSQHRRCYLPTTKTLFHLLRKVELFINSIALTVIVSMLVSPLVNCVLEWMNMSQVKSAVLQLLQQQIVSQLMNTIYDREKQRSNNLHCLQRPT